MTMPVRRLLSYILFLNMPFIALGDPACCSSIQRMSMNPSHLPAHFQWAPETGANQFLDFQIEKNKFKTFPLDLMEGQQEKKILLRPSGMRRLMDINELQFHITAENTQLMVAEGKLREQERILVLQRRVIFLSVGAFFIAVTAAAIIYRYYRCVTQAKKAHSFGKVLLDTSVNAEREAQRGSVTRKQCANYFWANLSHEIKTPMNAILGFSEILMKSDISATNMHYVRSIYRSGNSLLSLMNDILDLSKIELGDVELVCSPVSVAAINSEMQVTFSERMKKKGLEFQVIMENPPPRLVLDEDRLKQALTKILDGILILASNGQVLLETTWEYANNQDKSLVNLKMMFSSQTRVNIEPLSHRFPIPSSAGSTKDSNNELLVGIELRLAISRHLVRKMNGTLEVECSDGGETRFIVFLPGVAVAREDMVSLQKKKGTTSTVQFLPSSILIVDDVDYNREIVAAFLAEWPLTIIEAESGVQALELAADERPDLIILDMKMPIMDGYEVAEKLKRQELTQGIPIVAFTASALKQDRERKVHHWDGFLRKPVHQKELITELMKFLPHERITVEDQSVHKVKSQDYILPSRDELVALHELTVAGNINGLKKKALTLTKEYRLFAEELIHMAELYQMDRLEKTIKEAMEKVR